MKRQIVKSSNINSIGYDKNDNVLEVEFKTGSIYHYKNVPMSLVEEFINSESIGRFFNKQIRNCIPFIKGEYEAEVTLPNIYICGKAGAGKTFSAKYLMKKCGYIQAKFAFPVYGLAYDYFKMDKKDRKLLQIIGTESGREVVSENIWVNRFIEDTKIVKLTREKLGLPNVGLISDDCRFLNEHEALKQDNWVGIFLNASDEVRIKRLGIRDGDAQVGTLAHSSELDVDKFKDDLIQIDASGTLEDTYKQLDALINILKTEA